MSDVIAADITATFEAVVTKADQATNKEESK